MNELLSKGSCFSAVDGWTRTNMLRCTKGFERVFKGGEGVEEGRNFNESRESLKIGSIIYIRGY